MIDAHTHLTFDPVFGYQQLGISIPKEALIGAKNARVTLEAGFTTVRNVGAHGFTDVSLMHAINARGTFMVSKYAIPHLLRAGNPHILMNSPPLDIREKWFAGSTGYSMAKFGMSLVVLGLAGELRGKVAVNALWPRTVIDTAAVRNLLGGADVARPLA